MSTVSESPSRDEHPTARPARNVEGIVDHSLPDHLRRVHMVGIGGAGMSGLARILLARGGQVSGSDAKAGRGILALRARGAHIQIGHDPSALDQIPGGPSVVVTTHAAIPKTNPELVAARSRGIPILLRPHVLAELMSGYRTVLIAGTHGKTSTTSMTVVALQHCGVDPSFAIGGELNESGTNAHHGNGAVFVAEADESDGSLLEYTPDVVVVTNIEVDHLDFFGTVERYVAVFDEFVARIAPGGVLIVCLDDPGASALAARCAAGAHERGVTVLGYGTQGVMVPAGVSLVATLVSWTPSAVGGDVQVRFSPPLPTLDAADRLAAPTAGEPVSVALRIPGIHMARNAIGAIVAAVCAGGGDVATVVSGIEAFSGVRRRFELRGRAGGVAVYDDYAHHPTEVAAVLNAAQAMITGKVTGDGRSETDGQSSPRVIAVFQPHLYTRTQEFATEFAASLELADEVVVTEVYGAREEPIPGVSGRLIADQMRTPARFVPDISLLPAIIADIAKPGDVVLTLGAGDITMQGPEIVAALRGAAPADSGEAEVESAQSAGGVSIVETGDQAGGGA